MQSRRSQANTLDLRPDRKQSGVNFSSPRGGWRPTKRFWLVTAGLVLLAGAGVLAYVVFGNSKSDAERGEAEVKTVMARVSKHYLLPGDETPALATITDKSKLTSPVFKQAEDGDNVLIYQKHKMAIVYRPSKDRIVAVVPVAIDEPTNITQDR